MMTLLEPETSEYLAIALLGFLAGDVGTLAAREYALARGVLDVPNERSAHSRPTPRGGGIAIAATVLAGVALATVAGVVERRLGIGLLGGGLMVAVVGWLDDHGGLRARTRFCVHLAAALWFLAWIGGYPVLRLGFTEIELGLAGSVLAAIGIVWGINFFNFMDGIDGLAGLEAVFVGAVGGAFLIVSGDRPLGLLALLIAATSAGFLRWNWSPAVIFMGDVGSTLLGFMLCAIAVASANRELVPMITWGTLMGVFVFDATVTVVRRFLQGYPIQVPHREFAFHRAVRLGRSHRRVCLKVLGLNLVLGILATVGWAYPGLLVPMALLGVGLLTAVYLYLERRLPMYTGPERRRSLLGLPELRRRGDDEGVAVLLGEQGAAPVPAPARREPALSGRE
ncbi:MAG TPA: glycosyltransferase family 4 protein [Gemmatimonadales bacterium]|nr:glycosyltransferase family 4 protein [Gemmatimonadales bacterium]